MFDANGKDSFTINDPTEWRDSDALQNSARWQPCLNERPPNNRDKR